MSRGAASITVAAIVVALWVFVEWRAKAPSPPALKPMPWEIGK